jgi:hypothetical protein
MTRGRDVAGRMKLFCNGTDFPASFASVFKLSGWNATGMPETSDVLSRGWRLPTASAKRAGLSIRAQMPGIRRN